MIHVEAGSSADAESRASKAGVVVAGVSHMRQREPVLSPPAARPDPQPNRQSQYGFAAAVLVTLGLLGAVGVVISVWLFLSIPQRIDERRDELLSQGRQLEVLRVGPEVGAMHGAVAGGVLQESLLLLAVSSVGLMVRDHILRQQRRW